MTTHILAETAPPEKTGCLARQTVQNRRAREARLRRLLAALELGRAGRCAWGMPASDYDALIAQVRRALDEAVSA